MKEREGSVEPQVRALVDPIACEGIGLCAHLAPETVTVDSWGFPIVDDTVLRGRALRRARAAASACPRKAFLLESAPSVSRVPGSRR